MQFDDSNITWRKLDILEHVSYYVYDVDEERRIVDVLFKFEPNQQAQLHRHLVPYVTFVLQGELRFHRADGELYEVRPTGSYVHGIADGPPHTEGAGDQEAIVYFSHRDVDGAMYELLDDDLNPVHVLGIADFKAEFEDQARTGATAKVAGRKVEGAVAS
jgi:quercetin dioxygenase-like cupin family protein